MATTDFQVPTERETPLLPRVAMGDREAFEELYDRYSPVLYGLLVRILGDSEDAQEMLQESFVQIWNRAGMYDGSRGSEIAWLVAIARSRGIDRLRSRKTRGTRETDAGREISIQSSYVDRGSAVESVLVAEQQKLVRQALGDLPENQRITLELAYFEGLSQSEIAARLGEPLGTVKTRTQLGMKKMRERLRSAFGR